MGPLSFSISLLIGAVIIFLPDIIEQVGKWHIGLIKEKYRKSELLAIRQQYHAGYLTQEEYELQCRATEQAYR